MKLTNPGVASRAEEATNLAGLMAMIDMEPPAILGGVQPSTDCAEPTLTVAKFVVLLYGDSVTTREAGSPAIIPIALNVLWDTTKLSESLGTAGLTCRLASGSSSRVLTEGRPREVFLADGASD